MMYHWVDSALRLELMLSMDDVKSCAHSGDCLSDVIWLSYQPHIFEQTDNWSPEILRSVLKEYGAWNDEKLSDHKINVKRMVWIACNDVKEDPDWYAID